MSVIAKVRNNTAVPVLAVALATAGLVPAVHAADAMYIDGSSNVGVGTNTPSQPLHVWRNDSTAQLLVEETGTPANPNAGQVMFYLKRAGAVRFDMEDSSQTATWTFQNRLGSFNISKVGTGVQEMTVDGSGNLVIQGTLTQGSSRTLKENITPVNSTDVLSRIEAMPVYTWNYKTSADEDRHLGPMAEDFSAAFGLGVDSRHIAPGDLAGVAVAGVKELHAQVLERDTRVQTLERENEELKRRLTALEETMAAVLRSSSNVAAVSH